MFFKVDDLTTVAPNCRLGKALLQDNEICAFRNHGAGKNTHAIPWADRPMEWVTSEALTDQAQGLCCVEIFAPHCISVHG
jgi:hypothetical protein